MHSGNGFRMSPGQKKDISETFAWSFSVMNNQVLIATWQGSFSGDHRQAEGTATRTETKGLCLARLTESSEMEILSSALIIKEIRSKTSPLSICFRSSSFQIPPFASKYVIITMKSKS
jgi:hypothetical protein